MIAGVTAKPFAIGPAAARLLPFAAFIGLMMAEPLLAGLLGERFDPRWLYGLRSGVAALLLLLFWRHYEELHAVRCRPAALLLTAPLAGLGVLIVWLTLDGGPFVLGGGGSGFVPLAADGSLLWPLAIVRLLGSALVVPLIEELFWRSLVMRWLERSDFATLAPAAVGLRAVLLSSLAFGFEHSLWAAGIVAGLVYALLYRRTGCLWSAVVAHAVTNGSLGLWVLYAGAWQYW
jgi:CAAX prenyl protease-like protein